jgi:hypothetical protein
MQGQGGPPPPPPSALRGGGKPSGGRSDVSAAAAAAAAASAVHCAAPPGSSGHELCEAPRISEDCLGATISAAAAAAPRAGFGSQNRLPIVIVPGMCSSGLKVVKSRPKPDWENERLWLSIQRLAGEVAEKNVVAKGIGKGLRTVKSGGERLMHTVSAGAHTLLGGAGRDKGAAERGGGGSLGGGGAAPALRVVVRQARGLPACDDSGLSDPFVVLTLLDGAGQRVGRPVRSTTKPKTLEPYWDEALRIGPGAAAGTGGGCDGGVVHRATTLRVDVMDRDLFSRNDRMGHVTVPLPPLEGLEAAEDGQGSSGSRTLVSRRWWQLTPSDDDAAVWLDAAEAFPEIELWVELLPPPSSQVSRASSTGGSAAPSSPEQPSPSASSRGRGRAAGLPETAARDQDAASPPVLSEAEMALKFAGRCFSDAAVRIQAWWRTCLVQTRILQEQYGSLDRLAWLRHMVLGQDGHSDPPGIKVRALEGLAGVDYLQPGAIMNATTWVFGKTIASLKEHGYDERCLKAVPYDWRLPPVFLEERDGFFSSMCQMIKTTYEENDGRAVVLLAHSMGNNMTHYFLHWALLHHGRAWLDRYIHSWFAVAAPLLGARQPCRTAISGTDMGLGAFLTDTEVLMMCRSIGTTPWIFPTSRLTQPISGTIAPLFLRADCLVLIHVRELRLAQPYHGSGSASASASSEGRVRAELRYTRRDQQRDGAESTASVSTNRVRLKSAAQSVYFGEHFQFVSGAHSVSELRDSVSVHLHYKGEQTCSSEVTTVSTLLTADRAAEHSGVEGDPRLRKRKATTALSVDRLVPGVRRHSIRPAAEEDSHSYGGNPTPTLVESTTGFYRDRTKPGFATATQRLQLRCDATADVLGEIEVSVVL